MSAGSVYNCKEIIVMQFAGQISERKVVSEDNEQNYGSLTRSAKTVSKGQTQLLHDHARLPSMPRL